MPSITSLEITGYRDAPLANTFFRQEGEARRLAIVLPGIGYTADMPVLYYPRALLLEMGADVLAVRYAYNENPEFSRLSGEERMRWVDADVDAASAAGLAQRPYEEITLVGKSLGTLAMAYLLEANDRLAGADCVWLTPVLADDRLRARIGQRRHHALFVIGTADPYYQPAWLDEVRQATGGDAMVVEGADHSLELAGSVDRSLDVMQQLVRTLRAFFEH
jgi:hypothetical protein